MSTVLVTGANRGLGLEFARQYSADGARVFACCRDPKAAKDLNALAKDSNGRVTVHAVNVADDKSVLQLKADIGSAPIDILINNAGIYGPENQSTEKMDYAGWTDTLAINSMGPLRMVQSFRPNLKAGDEKKVITITSGMGSIAETSGGYIAYRSSKAAVNMVMRVLSLELKPDGIICVPIHPGWVQTDMGGSSAPLTPSTSISRMRKIIAGLRPKDSGRFLSQDEREIPW